MYVIGLTGGIASGKTLVANILTGLGALIIDADQVARKVVEPGTVAWQKIIKYFGPQTVLEDKSLNRKYIGRVIFGDVEKRDILNSIVHPAVIENFNNRLKELEHDNYQGVVVLDIPLFFEVGMQDFVDVVWVVYVDHATQVKRLMERDNLSLKDAEERTASQLSLEEKAKLGDRIIDNRGSREKTEEIVRKLWQETIQEKDDQVI